MAGLQTPRICRTPEFARGRENQSDPRESSRRCDDRCASHTDFVWVPRDVDEIERAIAAGDLEETPSFEAKEQLPEKKKLIDAAIDIAAMTGDGGVILYGAGEDENKQITVRSPIPLVGAADRIGQVVSTSISEVPFIETREYPTTNDPSIGYLVVIVPQSARAPHQVTVKDDLRFYGRGAKGNRRLTEGDVARLYERRQTWEVDRERVMAEVVANAPAAPREGLAYVHAFARPVAADNGILERARASTDDFLKFLRGAVRSKLRGRYQPDLEGSAQLFRHGGDEWRWSSLSPDEIEIAASEQSQNPDPSYLVVVGFNLDGRGHLFCGRAADTLRTGGAPTVMEQVIAGNVETFLALMHDVYSVAGYHGHVDIGVALTGLRGATSQFGRYGRRFPYPTDEYARTERVAAGELSEAEAVARRLLRHFFDAVTGFEGFDPWD